MVIVSFIISIAFVFANTSAKAQSTGVGSLDGIPASNIDIDYSQSGLEALQTSLKNIYTKAVGASVDKVTDDIATLFINSAIKNNNIPNVNVPDLIRSLSGRIEKSLSAKVSGGGRIAADILISVAIDIAKEFVVDTILESTDRSSKGIVAAAVVSVTIDQAKILALSNGSAVAIGLGEVKLMFDTTKALIAANKEAMSTGDAAIRSRIASQMLTSMSKIHLDFVTEPNATVRKELLARLQSELEAIISAYPEQFSFAKSFRDELVGELNASARNYALKQGGICGSEFCNASDSYNKKIADLTDQIIGDVGDPGNLGLPPTTKPVPPIRTSNDQFNDDRKSQIKSDGTGQDANERGWWAYSAIGVDANGGTTISTGGGEPEDNKWPDTTVLQLNGVDRPISVSKLGQGTTCSQYTCWGRWQGSGRTITVDTGDRFDVKNGHWIQVEKSKDSEIATFATTNFGPRIGSATYRGNVVGDYMTFSGAKSGVVQPGAVTGSINLDANFKNSTVTGAMWLNVNRESWANTTFDLRLKDGNFRGPMTVSGGGEGAIGGAVAGPKAEEFGGDWRASSGGRNGDFGIASGVFSASR